MVSYVNACEVAGIELIAPYASTLPSNLDLERIRSDNPKYIVREAFKKLYPDFEITKKLPMPRPTNEWFKDWDSPTRRDFIEDCQVSLTDDQKCLVYCLEQFLNIIDGKVE